VTKSEISIIQDGVIKKQPFSAAIARFVDLDRTGIDRAVSSCF
jgi:hypothetical protein